MTQPDYLAIAEDATDKTELWSREALIEGIKELAKAVRELVKDRDSWRAQWEKLNRESARWGWEGKD